MKIGELVLYQGRRCYLRGFDPIGVPDGQAFLEDASTGEELVVPRDELASEAADAPPRPDGV